jgi:hypothetical protein
MARAHSRLVARPGASPLSIARSDGSKISLCRSISIPHPLSPTRSSTISSGIPSG